MPKSAAQLVPLRTQLKDTLDMRRFTDATTDFHASPFNSGNFVGVPGASYIEWEWDNSGAKPALGTTFASTPLPAAATTDVVGTVAGLTGSVDQGTDLTGIYRHYGLYWVTFYDASARESQPMALWYHIPPGDSNRAIQFQITLPAGATGAYIYKPTVSTSGCYRTTITASGSYTDTGSIGSAYGTNWFYLTSAGNVASTAPNASSANVTLSIVAGGSFAAQGHQYSVSALGLFGDSLQSDTQLPAVVHGIPLIPDGKLPAPTAAPDTVSGTVAAGTYYYRISCWTERSTWTSWWSNEGRSQSESLPSDAVEAILAGTGRVVLNWTTNVNAKGYVIYRGTTADNITYLTTVGMGVGTYIDTGATTPSANLKPSTSYLGAYTRGKVSLSWTAKANATGYILRRNGAPTTIVPNSTACGGWLKDGNATTTHIDDGTSQFTSYAPSTNMADRTNIRAVMRRVRFTTVTLVRTVGVTFIPVAGKRYKIWVGNSSLSNVYNGGYVTFSAAVPTYLEADVNLTMSANTEYYFGIVGEDSGAIVTWPHQKKPDTSVWGAPDSLDDGPFVSPGWNWTAQSGVIDLHSSVYGSTSYLHVIKGTPEQRAVMELPMRLLLRQDRPSTARVNAATALVGSTLPIQTVTTLANNVLSTPIKSIVPTWNMIAPSANVPNLTGTAAVAIKVEVSPDVGANWYTVKMGERFIFPATASNLQWRITMPGKEALATLTRASMTSLPAYGVTIPSNTYLRSDTGHLMYDWNTSGTDNRLLADGYLKMSDTYNTYPRGQLSFVDVGVDADFTAEVMFDGTGQNVGIGFRHDISSSFSGLYFYLQSDGAVGLNRMTSTTAGAAMVTVAGAFNGYLPNISYKARVVQVNNKIQCFVDNRLVIEHTDTTYYQGTQFNDWGVRGSRGIVKKMECIPIGPSAPSTFAVPFELDNLVAYLEP